jgi:nitrogen regulatory protein PII
LQQVTEEEEIRKALERIAVDRLRVAEVAGVGGEELERLQGNVLGEHLVDLMHFEVVEDLDELPGELFTSELV